MRARGEGFYAFARRLSQEHHQTLVERQLSAESEALLEREAQESLAGQAAIEAADDQDLDSFLARYFAGL
jgi:glutamate--cysteine ligase